MLNSYFRLLSILLSVIFVISIVPVYADQGKLNCESYSKDYNYQQQFVKLDYNHQITNGEIEKICFDNDYKIIISLKDIISNTILTIDIPYTDMPLATIQNHGGFVLDVDGADSTPLKITHQYPKYQTFDIDLVSYSNYVVLTYYSAYLPTDDDVTKGLVHNYNLTIPLLDLEKTPCKSNFVSIIKHDNSKSVCVKQTNASL